MEIRVSHTSHPSHERMKEEVRRLCQSPNLWSFRSTAAGSTAVARLDGMYMEQTSR
jgi:hypothetical protein